MSKYPEMTAPDHQPPILTGDCHRDIERGIAWHAPDAVKLRRQAARVWSQEKADREQERLARIAAARAERKAQEELAEQWAQEIEAAAVVARA
jgi:hypothetical protein